MEIGIIATVLGIATGIITPVVTFTLWMGKLGNRTTVLEKRVLVLEQEQSDFEDKFAELQREFAELKTELRTGFKSIQKEMATESKHVREILEFVRSEILERKKGSS